MTTAVRVHDIYKFFGKRDETRRSWLPWRKPAANGNGANGAASHGSAAAG